MLWTVLCVTCDVMRCDAMRCDAMRCDAMRCDAMRCDVVCRKPKCLKRASASASVAASSGATHAGAGPGDVEGDNCCACHMAAFRVIANSGAGDLEHFVADEDVVFLTFANDALYRLVFAVVLDHVNQAVVVVVRGTMSFKVLLFFLLLSFSSPLPLLLLSSSSSSLISFALVLASHTQCYTHMYATIYPRRPEWRQRADGVIHSSVSCVGPGMAENKWEEIVRILSTKRLSSGPFQARPISRIFQGQYFK